MSPIFSWARFYIIMKNITILKITRVILSGLLFFNVVGCYTLAKEVQIFVWVLLVGSFFFKDKTFDKKEM